MDIEVLLKVLLKIQLKTRTKNPFRMQISSASTTLHQLHTKIHSLRVINITDTSYTSTLHLMQGYEQVHSCQSN